jgi:hypothetical protein
MLLYAGEALIDDTEYVADNWAEDHERRDNNAGNQYQNNAYSTKPCPF